MFEHIKLFISQNVPVDTVSNPVVFELTTDDAIIASNETKTMNDRNVKKLKFAIIFICWNMRNSKNLSITGHCHHTSLQLTGE